MYIVHEILTVTYPIVPQCSRTFFSVQISRSALFPVTALTYHTYTLNTNCVASLGENSDNHDPEHFSKKTYTSGEKKPDSVNFLVSRAAQCAG